MVASVPLLTRRTCSMEGIRRVSISAKFTSASVGAPKLVPLSAAFFTAPTTSGSAWPRIKGPQEPT